MPTRIFSPAFHTSHQYQLATAFPDIEWHFIGDVWSTNRPLPRNVHLDCGDVHFHDFDAYLAHTPIQYQELKVKLETQSTAIHKLIYVAHQGYRTAFGSQLFGSLELAGFVEMVAHSPIVCVSHYMVHDYGFYSHRICESIPHYIPLDLFGPPSWTPGGNKYMNVVNNFYAPSRGVGAGFWDGLTEVPKILFGSDNKPTDGGQLRTVSDFRTAVSTASAFLWTADGVAISFAPLEAMACGCPLIAPSNLDWPRLFSPNKEILLYTPDDKASLLSVLEKFQSSRSLQETLSKYGREAIASRFTLELYRTRWSRVLNEAMRKH